MKKFVKFRKSLVLLTPLIFYSLIEISHAMIIQEETLPPILKGVANTISVPTNSLSAEMHVKVESNSISNLNFDCTNSTLTTKNSLSGTIKIGNSIIKVLGICSSSNDLSNNIEVIGTNNETLVRLNAILKIADTNTTIKGTIRVNNLEYLVEFNK